MYLKKLGFTYFLSLLFFSELAAAACTMSPCVTGVFQWPFSPYSGYKQDQYTMQWNSQFSKYHLADDWNGNGGGSTDYGDSIYAIADGVVADVDAVGISAPSIGKVIRVRYLLPDGKQIDSEYMHLKDVLVAVNAPVSAGQKIATLGDANGYYAGSAHLHWEVRTDLMLGSLANPYYNPHTIATALKYTSPSVLVDDRASGGMTVALSPGAWKQFTVGQITPQALVFIQDQAGQRYSIKKAVDAGILASYGISWNQNGVWYYNPDVTQVTMYPGTTYQLYAQAPSLALNVLYAGNHFKHDRARMDIVRAASSDARFKNVLTETYGENLTGDPSWEYRWMGLNFVSNNGTSWTVYIQQTTYKSNPFLRYTNFWDPNISQWTPWVEVGMNVLYMNNSSSFQPSLLRSGVVF